LGDTPHPRGAYIIGVGIRIPSFRRRPEPRGRATFERIRGRTSGMTYSYRNPEKVPCVYLRASQRNGTLYMRIL
jgi:hypothetical protein